MTPTQLGLDHAVFILAQDSASQGPIVPGAPSAGAGPSVQPADGSGTAQPLPVPQGSGGQPGFPNMLWPLLLVMVLFILMTSMSGRKERRKRAELLGGVSRNDRVQTVGGVIGTVVELTDTEMVLRVDEASNTRVRFARSALQQILRSSKDKNRENGNDVEVKPPVQTRA
jgi:preprotein translocase subunit YajC